MYSGNSGSPIASVCKSSRFLLPSTVRNFHLLPLSSRLVCWDHQAMGRACPRALNAAHCTVWHGLDRINDRVYARRTTSLLSNHHDMAILGLIWDIE